MFAQLRPGLIEFPDTANFLLFAAGICETFTGNYLINQPVTICDRLAYLRHSSINPLAFTEQGVAMLSSVLRSEKAIEVNIEIMRAFARYRAILRENEELRKEIQIIEEKLNNAFQFLLERIDELHQVSTGPRRPIGYRSNQD